MYIIPKPIVDELKIDIDKFIELMSDEDKEEYKEKYKTDSINRNDIFLIYFLNVLDLPFMKLSMIHNRLRKVCSDDEVRQFIYMMIKLKHKIDDKIWSWDEAMEYEIDFINKTTVNYTI
jgi:hypothetical protein